MIVVGGGVLLVQRARSCPASPSATDGQSVPLLLSLQRYPLVKSVTGTSWLGSLWAQALSLAKSQRWAMRKPRCEMKSRVLLGRCTAIYRQAGLETGRQAAAQIRVQWTDVSQVQGRTEVEKPLLVSHVSAPRNNNRSKEKNNSSHCYLLNN